MSRERDNERARRRSHRGKHYWGRERDNESKKTVPERNNNREERGITRTRRQSQKETIIEKGEG